MVVHKTFGFFERPAISWQTSNYQSFSTKITCNSNPPFFSGKIPRPLESPCKNVKRPPPFLSTLAELPLGNDVITNAPPSLRNRHLLTFHGSHRRPHGLEDENGPQKNQSFAEGWDSIWVWVTGWVGLGYGLGWVELSWVWLGWVGCDFGHIRTQIGCQWI